MKIYLPNRKLVAFEIILLFVGVAIAPSTIFNRAKAAPSNKTVEFTSKPVAFPGYAPQTMTLIEHKASNVDESLKRIKRSLENATTRE